MNGRLYLQRRVRPSETIPEFYSHSENIGNTADVGVSLNYHLIPNKLVGSINYVHTFARPYELDYLNDIALDSYHWGTTNDVGVLADGTFQ